MGEIDRKLAARIDHTLLRPEADAREIDRLCVEALRFGFAAVCVQPVWVARAARTLAGSRVAVASVVAFPHGANVTAVKVAEATRARDDGATELDVVANLGAIRPGPTPAGVGAVELVLEAHGGGAARAHGGPHDELVVVPRGSMIRDVRLDDRQHEPVRLLERAVRRAREAQVLVARDLEVAQVVRVVDHPHLIGVAIDDAYARDLAQGRGGGGCGHGLGGHARTLPGGARRAKRVRAPR